MRNFATHFWTRFTSDDFKEKPAFVQLESDGTSSELTYWAWTRRVQKIAVGLMDAGFESGTRMGIVAPNSQEWIDLAFAVWMVGGVVVPLPSNWGRRQTLRCLARTGAQWVALGSEEARLEIRGQGDKLPPLEWIVLRGETSKQDSVRSLLDLQTQGKFRAKRGDLKLLAKRTYGLEPQSPALILFPFDGETEDPHGALFKGGKLAILLEYLAEGMQWQEDDRVAVLASYGWLYGILAALSATFAGKTTLVGSSLGELREGLGKLAPTAVVCGPAFVESLAAEIRTRVEATPDFVKLDETQGTLSLKRAMQVVSEKAAKRFIYEPLRADLGRALDRVYLAGGAIDGDVEEILEAAGVAILSMWGVPEAGISHVERAGSRSQRSVGRPLQGYVCKIEGAKTDEAGEILLRGDVLFDGYWDEKGPLAFTESGYLATGRQGRVRSAYLFLEDD